MSVDVTQLVELKNKLEEIQQGRNKILDAIAKELADRLSRKVKKRTPVSETIAVYKRNSKNHKRGDTYTKKGGTLRRGWTVGKPRLLGNYCEISVSNDVFYVSYVENGHRQQIGRYVPAIGKRLKRGWVPGKKMLRLSVDELQKDSQKIIEAKIRKWIGSVFS